MTVKRRANVRDHFPEPERLLRELQYMADYWDRQAVTETRQYTIDRCQRRKDRCVQMAERVQRFLDLK